MLALIIILPVQVIPNSSPKIRLRMSLIEVPVFLTLCGWMRNCVFILSILVALNILVVKGPRFLLDAFLLNLPGFKFITSRILKKELTTFLKQTGIGGGNESDKGKIKPLPEKGEAKMKRSVL